MSHKHKHHETPSEQDQDAAAQQEAAEPKPGGSLEQLQAELAAAKDRAIRSHAELENYRKRADRQIEEERRFANMPLLRDLLPVLDNVYRAIESAEKTSASGPLLDGVRLVAEQLESVLKRHHCLPIKALGEPFDPHLHEAIAHHPSDEAPANTVTVVTQNGFQLHGRVVRPSQVVVSAGKPAAPAAEGPSETQ